MEGSYVESGAALTDSSAILSTCTFCSSLRLSSSSLVRLRPSSCVPAESITCIAESTPVSGIASGIASGGNPRAAQSAAGAHLSQIVSPLPFEGHQELRSCAAVAAELRLDIGVTELAVLRGQLAVRRKDVAVQ